jgi:hypothetical protein
VSDRLRQRDRCTIGDLANLERDRRLQSGISRGEIARHGSGRSQGRGINARARVVDHAGIALEVPDQILVVAALWTRKSK